MFKKAVAEQRDMQIKHLDADDQVGNTNGTSNRPIAVVGRAELTDEKAPR